MSLTDTINQINSNTALMNHARGQTKLGKSDFDSADFMQMMLAQLKYQDPTNPVDQTQFMGQQAQMTQVSKMDELVKAMQGNAQMSQSASLVGKRVEVLDAKTQEKVTGTVDSVSFAEGSAGLNINGTSYPLSQITKVFGN